MSHGARVTGFVGVVAWVLAGGTGYGQELLPRFDFHLNTRYATSGDPRFNWIFDFGGDLDAVRADGFRAVFLANYEAIAGEQFRRFDVNQGNYLIEGALLFRVAGLELGPVWHHVSRHLSDRAKRMPVDWNMLAFRVANQHARGPIDLSWRADARTTVMNSFVDYQWELEMDGGLDYRLMPRVALIGGATWRVVGVDGSRERGTQVGARLEAGVRVEGGAVAAELFVGGERRVDPFPTEFGTASWFMAGLRLKSR